MHTRLWLVYAVITTTCWGVWGALIELPEKAGFPATLGYVVWSVTMIPPSLVALSLLGWKFQHDAKSILLGTVVGLLGAAGQLILFQALTLGPAYIVFPLVSLSPLVTILLSLLFLNERASVRGWWGIGLALVAIPLLAYQAPAGDAVNGFLWLLLALGVFLFWGLQAYVIKFATRSMQAESIFFYMMVTAVLLAPAALVMTDFSRDINWGVSGPYLAAVIQTLNSMGALTLVFAFRYGRAIIVAPMTNALAPVITIVLSLVIYGVIPSAVTVVGLALAIAAAFLMALEEEPPPTGTQQTAPLVGRPDAVSTPNR